MKGSVCFGLGGGKGMTRKGVLFFVVMAGLAVFLFFPYAQEILRGFPDRFSGKARFPGAKAIEKSGEYLQVEGSSDLVPVPGKDFMLVFWVKIAGLPKPGEIIVLLSKFSSEQENVPGFAFAVRHDHDGAIRPVVYWRSEEGLGRWYSFSEADLSARNWVMFSLSYYNDHFLGLHVISRDESKKYSVRVLGGYEFEDAIFPVSTEDLKIGAVGSSKFRGKIGPLGVFLKYKMSKDFEKIFADMIENPSDPPGCFEDNNVRFWSADGKVNIGSGGYQLKFKSPRLKKNRKKKKK